MMSDPFHNDMVNDFFFNIPDAILAKILKTLPVKSLLRCMCIQKSWYYLIKTSDFIKCHSNYHHHRNITTTATHYNDLPKYLLFRCIRSSKLLGLRYDDEHCKEFHKLEVPPVIRLGKRTFWLATSCTLICVYTIYSNLYGDDEDNIYLWNPLIQKCKTLPLLDLSIFQTSWTWKALAFGYVPPINDFQVVRLVSYDSNRSPSILICVYSLNTNSWKTKSIQDDIFVHIRDGYDDSVSVNGISCWRAYKKLENGKLDTVLYFDTLKDVLGTIPLPNQVGNYNHSLHQFDQSVALFVHDEYLTDSSMWVLKQDSINNFFWEKMISTVRLYGHVYKAVILGSRNNGELILSTFYETNLVSYNPETKKEKDFFSSWKRWITLRPYDLYYRSLPFSVHPFVAGLVLLDTD